MTILKKTVSNSCMINSLSSINYVKYKRKEKFTEYKIHLEKHEDNKIKPPGNWSLIDVFYLLYRAVKFIPFTDKKKNYEYMKFSI